MASKSAIYKDYLIVQEDSGSIKLLRVYDNVKDSLRQIAKVVGFSYEDSWTTRQFGSKLVKEYGSNGVAQVGEYGIRILSSGSIESFKLYGNTKEGLREIASAAKFKYEDSWTTRQFGSKLIDFLNGK